MGLTSFYCFISLLIKFSLYVNAMLLKTELFYFILKLFRNPDVPEGKTLQEVFEAAGAVKPRDWHLAPWELDTEKAENNGFQNEDLIVWMRAAALPNFR